MLEITLEGDRKKDLEINVERYARLGIDEYFVLDLKLNRSLGFRIVKPNTYEPIALQSGRWASQVLGLDLALELGRVRFFAGSAPLPYSEELIARLDAMVDGLVSKEQALARELEAMTEKAEQEKARADRLAARLRELGVKLDLD